MAICLQPSTLLAEHLQLERQEGLMVFQFTGVVQARLEDLFQRRKDLGLSAEEQTELSL